MGLVRGSSTSAGLHVSNQSLSDLLPAAMAAVASRLPSSDFVGPTAEQLGGHVLTAWLDNRVLRDKAKAIL